MSENKFTPGPWNVAAYSYGIVVKTESDRKSKYGASRYACIGGFDRNDDAQIAEAEANANLIAAAPELLEALECLLDSLGALANKSELYGWMGEEDQEKIWKAIAKAKGEL